MNIRFYNVNRDFLNALDSIAKLAGVEFYIDGDEEAELSPEDEADLRELVEKSKRGELEFINLEEMKRQTDEFLENLKAKYETRVSS